MPFMNRDKHPRSNHENDEKREQHSSMPANYWTRIAEDAAHGYGADQNRHRNPGTKLNEDQLPGDNERG
jgi:hypothetical protein